MSARTARSLLWRETRTAPASSCCTSSSALNCAAILKGTAKFSRWFTSLGRCASALYLWWGRQHLLLWMSSRQPRETGEARIRRQGSRQRLSLLPCRQCRVQGALQALMGGSAQGVRSEGQERRWPGAQRSERRATGGCPAEPPQHARQLRRLQDVAAAPAAAAPRPAAATRVSCSWFSAVPPPEHPARVWPPDE